MPETGYVETNDEAVAEEEMRLFHVDEGEVPNRNPRKTSTDRALPGLASFEKKLHAILENLKIHANLLSKM